ncbi:MAG: NFACT family protein [Roseburia sp.]|nr:NFACT family protein [Roseburia sp.]MCM1278471.1 NFACT family protein [Robinsoniella sp.]
MAFDGITISCLVEEMKEKIVNGRIYKIAQPEKDELLLTIKCKKTKEEAGEEREALQHRLLLSADPSLPLAYFTKDNKKSPMTAPNFCMLLRKHIQNGRIVSITQPGLERIINIEIEHLNELGDLCRKQLIVELMGKHSNIIFCDGKGMILDSIKHISGMVSSVREVLPGREYFVPRTENKIDPVSGELSKEDFVSLIQEKSMPLFKSIYSHFTGISPIAAQEICYQAEVDADKPSSAMEGQEADRLAEAYFAYMKQVKEKRYQPFIVYEKKEPKEYCVLPLTIYNGLEREEFQSISALLEHYYAAKSAVTRIRQKSVDIRKIVQTALERNIKKYDLQCRQLKDTEKREKYKVYGELLHTYGYQAEPMAKSLEVENYYTGEMLSIPLDPDLTAMENAKKYFQKYNKLKRTYEALTEFTKETKEEIEHLETIMTALDIAIFEEDLAQIKEELMESGYIRRRGGSKKTKFTSRPYHFISKDGFHMYVGKNNYQNEELTFKLAEGNDWWFHAKGIPGSHVIVKSGGKEIADSTFEEAGRLAAHFSKARGQDKVEIDYVEKKQVKKPAGGKPGFVVYYTNYSLMIDSDISGIEEVKE